VPAFLFSPFVFNLAVWNAVVCLHCSLGSLNVPVYMYIISYFLTGFTDTQRHLQYLHSWSQIDSLAQTIKLLTYCHHHGVPSGVFRYVCNRQYFFYSTDIKHVTKNIGIKIIQPPFQIRLFWQNVHFQLLFDFAACKNKSN